MSLKECRVNNISVCDLGVDSDLAWDDNYCWRWRRWCLNYLGWLLTTNPNLESRFQFRLIAPSLALILRKVFAAIILWLVSMRDKLRGWRRAGFLIKSRHSLQICRRPQWSPFFFIRIHPGRAWHEKQTMLFARGQVILAFTKPCQPHSISPGNRKPGVFKPLCPLRNPLIPLQIQIIFDDNKNLSWQPIWPVE